MTFQCPYCGGSGELAECDFCGRVHPAYEIDENGRCPTCAEEEQARIEKEELEENEKGNIA
nr:MAG TPA: Cas system-associated protein [Caudoviricetes sp.]